MAFFLQWIVPLLILLISLIATWALPSEKQTQVVAPLLVGIIMFLLNRFLNYPNVVFKPESSHVNWVLDDNKCFRFWLKGTLVNESATGVGDLRQMTLRIEVYEGRFADVPVDRRIIGSRFLPHGVLQQDTFVFETSGIHTEEDSIRGKKAEVLLDVVGQGIKRYPVKLR